MISGHSPAKLLKENAIKILNGNGSKPVCSTINSRPQVTVTTGRELTKSELLQQFFDSTTEELVINAIISLLVFISSCSTDGAIILTATFVIIQSRLISGHNIE